MAFQPCPGIAEVAIRATYFSRPIATVLHFAQAGTITLSLLEDLADDVAGRWGSYMLPQLSESYVMTSVVATDLTVQGSWQYPSLVNVGEPGLQTATPGVPGNVNLCLTLRTAQIGRSFRGRVYIPGAIEGNVVGNYFNSTWCDNVNTALVNVGAAGSSAGWSWVVLSRQFNGVVRTNGIGTVIVASEARDTRVDTLRLRLPRS